MEEKHAWSQSIPKMTSKSNISCLPNQPCDSIRQWYKITRITLLETTNSPTRVEIEKYSSNTSRSIENFIDKLQETSVTRILQCINNNQKYLQHIGNNIWERSLDHLGIGERKSDSFEKNQNLDQLLVFKYFHVASITTNIAIIHAN